MPCRIVLLLFWLLLACSDKNNTTAIHESSPARDYTSFHFDALEYCKNNNFSQDYYILLDLSIHSGKNRFFVYDFNSQKILYEKPATHGSCDVFEENPDKWEKAKFSNREDSHCSSVGKYKIGKRDYSSWGIKIKYWLHGLENTNSNAVKRVVVLHSWEAVSDDEIYPRFNPLSWGCPAVSNEFMAILDQKLKATSKPVLLWIIE